MTEKELKSILKKVDLDALCDGIMQVKDFVLPVKGTSTLHLIFNPPSVRVDFRKVVDGKSETKTISLNVVDLDKLAKNIKFDKFMTEMGWE